MKIGETVQINKILMRALKDSVHLPKKLHNTLRELAAICSNPATIVSIETTTNEVAIRLKANDGYNCLPAVMCEGYNGGQGVVARFETQAQAEMLLETKDTIKLFNLYNRPIEGQQLVKLVYNNKNFVIIPVVNAKKISDYSGVIGRATSKILPRQEGDIQLITVSQAMDLKTHQKLTTRHFGRQG